eukprot:GHVT01007918.1.p1 GENE.GHVT01007918.1~~GHVT01007918.1.p1  ORF type:complete len:147 (-),score=4.03 GHVT01007918.1:960-1400(-)
MLPKTPYAANLDRLGLNVGPWSFEENQQLEKGMTLAQSNVASENSNLHVAAGGHGHKSNAGYRHLERAYKRILMQPGVKRFLELRHSSAAQSQYHTAILPRYSVLYSSPTYSSYPPLLHIQVPSHGLPVPLDACAFLANRGHTHLI